MNNGGISLKFTKRILCVLLAVLMAAAMVPGALADGVEDDTYGMTDLDGHWGKKYAVWAMEQGLFKGVTDTEFDPDGSMTRGMFVTVLGRFAGIDKSEYDTWYTQYLYTDVREGSYYAPYILWATRCGIAKGTGDGTFAPEDPITREQMATFMVRFAEIYHYDLAPITDQIVERFSDVDQVGKFAAESVEIMRVTGLIKGVHYDDGSYAFRPKANATRAECATLFSRLAESLQPGAESTLPEAPTSISLNTSTLQLYPQESAALYCYFQPYFCTNQTLIWFSDNAAVAKVSSSGVVSYVGPGTANIYAVSSNGLEAVCQVTCLSTYIAYAGESYADKCQHIFGTYTNDPRHFYATVEEVKQHLVTVQVQVWDFADSTHTTKVTKTRYVTVHENIAATVVKIFEEIYACEAQYPINYVGGYRWSSASEHTPGLAIDINPDQNYYCDAQGNAITGSHFDPENDPYSMPIDGEIQQIFEKYGFRRGIYWNSGKKDYMHYSFFGT